MRLDRLKSYQEALAQYHLHPEAKSHNGDHLHPESKFQNGDYTDQGFTRRRHIQALATEYIGKDANRWEEQLLLGLDLEAQFEYGIAPDDEERILAAVLLANKKFGQQKLAKASGISISEVSAILLGKRQPTRTTLSKLFQAIPRLEREATEEAEHVREVLDAVGRHCRLVGVREFARQAGVDGANLAKVLDGRREPRPMMLAKLEAALRK